MSPMKYPVSGNCWWPFLDFWKRNLSHEMYLYFESHFLFKLRSVRVFIELSSRLRCRALTNEAKRKRHHLFYFFFVIFFYFFLFWNLLFRFVSGATVPAPVDCSLLDFLLFFFVYFFYLSPISRWHITRPHTNTRARLRWAMRPPQNETKKMTAIVVDICFCGVFVFGYLLLGALFFFSFLLSCWVFFLAWTHSSETIDGGRNQQSLRCLRWWISVDFSSAVRAEVCDRRAAG